MTDYVCSKCECGFPEKVGRVTVSNPQWFGDPDTVDSWLHQWAIKFNNAFASAFKSAYYIQCPECGHKMGESGK